MISNRTETAASEVETENELTAVLEVERQEIDWWRHPRPPGESSRKLAPLYKLQICSKVVYFPLLRQVATVLDLKKLIQQQDAQIQPHLQRLVLQRPSDR